MTDLKDIYIQAEDDPATTNIDGKGYDAQMFHGVQIMRDHVTKDIKIFNPKGKDYYEELTPDEYLLFEEGWRKGVLNLVLQVYRNRLDVIEKKIPEVLNNYKYLSALKERRSGLLKKYFKLTQKLNQL
tara:strand:+ start:736 stop:1119 length:384 start_codon:yes stop_codon:yes gene_type:complete